MITKPRTLIAGHQFPSLLWDILLLLLGFFAGIGFTTGCAVACETTTVAFSGVIDSRTATANEICPSITSFAQLENIAALAHTVVVYDSSSKARNVHLGFFKGSADWWFCS